MVLRKTIQKTKVFFHKTLQNLKSFLFGGYQKLPKAPMINNIFCGSNGNQYILESDNFYEGFSGQWKTPSDDIREGKDNDMSLQVQKGDGECSESLTNIAQQIAEKITKEDRNKEEKKTAKCQEGISGEPSSQSLAKRLKELEMMLVNDVEHVLDIEEVLHYYSRLTCPAYLDILDKFFMHMYNEYLLPQPTVSANTSMRRNNSCEDSVQ